MSDRVFIDTNIFVYCELEDASHAHKRALAIELLNSLTDTDIVVSTQVLSELYNVLLKHNVKDAIIQKKLQDIINAAITQDINIATLKKGWKIRVKYKYSYYDSMIIAAGLETGCDILYSEDLQNGQVIEKTLTIKNPFI